MRVHAASEQAEANCLTLAEVKPLVIWLTATNNIKGCVCVWQCVYYRSTGVIVCVCDSVYITGVLVWLCVCDSVYITGVLVWLCVCVTVCILPEY